MKTLTAYPYPVYRGFYEDNDPYVGSLHCKWFKTILTVLIESDGERFRVNDDRICLSGDYGTLLLALSGIDDRIELGLELNYDKDTVRRFNSGLCNWGFDCGKLRDTIRDYVEGTE